MDKESATEKKSEDEAIEEQIVSAQPTAELNFNSNKNKTLIVGLIILIIIGAAYYLLAINPGILSVFNAKPSQESVVPSPTVTETVISDPQIDKDIQALNNKLSNLDTDFNFIDNGLSDKTLITE
ncbi:MAG: hypothetical protein WCV81_02500 [Microgenomates group bacterium]|jgi:hypothetical protein